MKNFDFKQDLLPHIIALVALFVIISVFFAPVYSGKSLVQNDIVQSKGASKSIQDHREKYGEEPLWTNSVFSGMPSFMISTLHKGEIFTDVFHAVKRILPKHVNLLFIGALCMYILLIILRCNPIIAATGAIGYVFSNYSLVSMEAGHNSKVETLAYLPLVLAGIYLIFKKDLLKGLVIGVIGTTMMLSAGHYQIMYYLFLGVIIISAYFLINIFKQKDFVSFGKMAGVFAIIVVLSLGNNFSKMFTNLDYIQNHSTRGKKPLKDDKAGGKEDAAMDYDYAFSWSNGWLETATLLIPYYYGGSSHENLGKKSKTFEALKQNNVPSNQAKNFTQSLPTYWGDQPFTSGPTYFGAVIFLFFFLSLIVWENKIKWYLLGAAILTWLLSLGDNFASLNYFLFDNLPGMNKFRAVAMATSVTQIFVLILAVIGMKRMLDEDVLSDSKRIFKGIGIALGSTLLLLIIGISQDFSGAVDAQLANQPEWILDAIREDRKSLLIGDSFRTLIFMILAGVAIFMRMNKKLTNQSFAMIICALVLVDLWTVSKRYINEDNFSKSIDKNPFQPTQANLKIMQDQSNYRVFNRSVNTFNDNSTSYFHQSVGGYRPAKMQRYQDMIERHLSKGNMKVINMLNTKYVIGGPNAKDVNVNPNALGNAWFVNNIISVQTPNEEIDKLKDFEPKTDAVVDRSLFQTSKDQFTGSGDIKLLEWRNNYLKYEYNANDDAFAVFSEIYYGDGWKATIDGEDKDHIRVNYLLRGMEVPKGKHTIEFVFKPDNYYRNNHIAMITSVISFLLIGFCVVLIVKQSKQEDNEESEE